MKYMLSIWSNAESWAALSAEGYDQIMGEHEAMSNELTESGALISSEALADPAHTKSVRVRDGVPATTDGPFAEFKEQLAGFYLIACESVDEAVAVAARLPEARYNAVEVRPVMDPAGLEW